MVLSGVNLKEEFVGRLSKVGIEFLEIVDSLHKVGTKSVLWTILLRTDNIKLFRRELELFFTQLIISAKTYIISSQR